MCPSARERSNLLTAPKCVRFTYCGYARRKASLGGDTVDIGGRLTSFGNYDTGLHGGGRGNLSVPTGRIGVYDIGITCTSVREKCGQVRGIGRGGLGVFK